MANLLFETVVTCNGILAMFLFFIAISIFMYVSFVISSVFTQRMPHDLAHPIVEKMDLGSQADPGPELTGICPEPRIKSLLNPY